ncbi:DUF2793 domain-containing protein [Qipengyuania huizhouensis]|uniref:DUF2793 domain-containing protein n=1 Tax=Qipengyuania huizhouensis TaxID=2867245 RepID=UPI001C87C051|nr:DUF2793 domain-containing protein [Qipengyuania huizhouensis]
MWGTEPVSGAAYLVAESGAGEFLGMDGMIASWDGQQWTFVAPTAGMMIRDISSGTFVRYSDGWERLIAPADPSGGTNADEQARAAISELIIALKNFGMFS